MASTRTRCAMCLSGVARDWCVCTEAKRRNGARGVPRPSTFLALKGVRLWLRRRRGATQAATPPHTLPAPPVTTPPDDLLQEQLRDVTFRIRNLSSLGVGHGAGFAIGSHLIVTSRHVVEGADPLEVTSWDGGAVEVAVADKSQDHDLALLTTVRTLQGSLELAPGPAGRGDLVRIVGYPLGGQFSLIRGLVVDQVDGRPFEDSSQVLRVKAVVLPGYSGGPIVDCRGQVVGVVYAQGRESRHALAIPTSSLRSWLTSAGLARFSYREDAAPDSRGGE